MRNAAVWLVLLGAAWVAPRAGVAGEAVSGKKPDVVIILADDMGFSDLGCYGSEIATPHLDRLASRGLRFTQFYNCARCCPTRAALLTGLYPHQAGVGHMVQDLGRPGYRGNLNDRCVTLAEVLRPAGYHTLLAGKWHVTPFGDSLANWPLQRGFERFYGLIGSVRSYYDPPTLTRDNQPTRAEGKDYYLTDAITDQALAYLDEHGRKPEPFLLYVAYTAPHWPLHARPEDVARCRARYRDGWDALRRQRHRRQLDMGLVEARWPLTPRDADAPAWAEEKHKEWQVERMAVYAAMIEAMDRGIGKLVEKLEKDGRLENTLLFFLSDNGGCAEEIPPDWRGKMFPKETRDGRPTRVGNDPAVRPGPADVFQSYGLPWANASNTPFRLYKHWVHEGGISTPLIVHWPAQVKKAALTHQPGHVIDLMATCLDAAGVEYPRTFQGRALTPLEGKSLLPIVRGQTRPGHAVLCWEHEGNRAVRQGKWKLVARFQADWELFNLDADRTETNNLAGKHPDKVKELAREYGRWARRCGVVLWETLSPKE
jgi:arylsulfatase